MRHLFVASLLFGLAATAAAQEPMNPYDAPPVVVAPPAAVVPGTVLQPYGQPMAPAVPAPYGAPTPGYYYPPTGYAAPMYSYPPPPVYYVRPVVKPRKLRCNGGWCQAQQAPVGKARLFSIGARFSVLGIDQSINGHDVVMPGGGVQLRFRTRGRFGLELAADFLHGKFSADATAGEAKPASATPGTTTPYFHIADVTRDSIPVTLSMLFYIFPNDDARIFNLYFLGGVGVVSTNMQLTDENGQSVKQGFTEWEGHLGIGAELRFRWLAIQADVRGIALSRDDSSAPASYYAGVSGGPVPKSSTGGQGTLGATIWF
jgi:hypothetical protein